jgi:hypothetical protein
MNLSLLAQVVPVALALLPGLHYDRLRRHRSGVGAQTSAAPQYGRVLLAGALVTAATVTLLVMLRSLGPRTLPDLPAEGPLRFSSPMVGTWAVLCFIAISLTTASLAAAVHLRLREGQSPLPQPRADGRNGAGAGFGKGDVDIEVEIRLNSGDTYRGLYGGRDRGAPYLTLNGPIFELDGHGKPLPLDALHWDQMMVPTRAISSVLVRPAIQQGARPAVSPDGATLGMGVEQTVRSRHSIPRSTLGCRVRAEVRRHYHDGPDAGVLSRLLASQIIVIGLVGLVSRVVT